MKKRLLDPKVLAKIVILPPTTHSYHTPTKEIICPKMQGKMAGTACSVSSHGNFHIRGCPPPSGSVQYLGSGSDTFLKN